MRRDGRIVLLSCFVYRIIVDRQMFSALRRLAVVLSAAASGGMLVTAWLAGRFVGAIRRWWGMALVNGLLVVGFLLSLPTIQG